jgi:hypothetical protein
MLLNKKSAKSDGVSWGIPQPLDTGLPEEADNIAASFGSGGTSVDKQSHLALWVAYIQLAKEACQQGQYFVAQCALQDALRDAEDYDELDDAVVLELRRWANDFGRSLQKLSA